VNSDHGFHLDGYKRLSVYRNNHGGGVSAYYAEWLDVCVIDHLTYIDDLVELLTFNVTMQSNKLTILCAYRPPMSDLVAFNDSFFDNILNNFPPNSKVLLCGDFNINLFNPLNLPNIAAFSSCLLSLGYFPVITKPTRFSQDNPITKYSLIDHIWSNFSLNPDHFSAIIDCEITDHLPIIYAFQLKDTPTIKKIITRPLHDSKITEFVQDVDSCGFDEIVTVNEPNGALTLFLNMLYSKYNRHIPLVTKTAATNNKFAPWLSRDITFLKRKKYKLLSQVRKGYVEMSFFRTFRNLLNYVIKKSKKLYYCCKILANSNDSKSTWKIINGLLGRCVAPSTIRIVKDGASLAPVPLVNEFNKYFSSIAARLVEGIVLPNSVYHAPFPLYNAVCSFQPTSSAEIKSIVNAFKSKRYNKLEIQPFILNMVLPSIGPVLEHIFNLCLSQGVYPDALKIARVVPIFKKGDRNDFGNYRPISTLSVFNKILEKIVHVRLSSFVHQHNIISDDQFGFMKNRNTTLAIFNLVQELLNTFHNKTYSICLFLDLRKAFDTVDFDILKVKLDAYGVRGRTLSLIESYLTNRTQFVTIDNVNSTSLPVRVGVPQGSVLGPLLFNIFINDITSIPNSNSILFADDAVFYVHGATFEEALGKMNTIIANLTIWLKNNKLLPHENKTKLMLVTPRRPPILPDMLFNNVKLEWIDKITYLGLVIDNKLSYSSHISELLCKLSKSHGAIYAVSGLLPRPALRTLYFSLVYPHIVQAVVLWGGVSDNLLKPVAIALNKILRTILHVKFDDNRIPLMSTNSMYRELGLLKLSDIHRLFVLKFGLNIINNYPLLFAQYIRPLIPNHSYRTRHSGFNLPNIRLEVERSGTIFQFVKVLNELPQFASFDYDPKLINRKFMHLIIPNY
jgi:hypothetical protein